MKRKTILNVMIALLLCASGFASLASAQDESSTEIRHNVSITVEDSDENEEKITITLGLVWEYPAPLRTWADIDEDGTVSESEASEYSLSLEDYLVGDWQSGHKSHVWTMSPGEDAEWAATSTTSNLEGATSDSDTFSISVSLTTQANEDALVVDDKISLTFGPLKNDTGVGISPDQFNTSVEIVDGDYCPSSIAYNGSDKTSPFIMKSGDNADFTVVLTEADCGRTTDGDDDKDGVVNSLDECPNTAEEDIPNVLSNGCVDDTTCQEGTDSDGDGVDDCFDTCPNSGDGATVDEDGCSQEQLGANNPTEDWTFNVTFSVDAAEFTCVGMNNDSTAQDCMDAAENFAGLSDVADVPEGHPHEWSWELQVNGMAVEDQNASNMALTSQSTFAWVAKCASGSAGCLDKTVFTVTELTGSLDIASGDCVFFDGVSPSFGDDWDNAGQSSRCFNAAGSYTSGDFTINVGSTASNNTTTEPIGNETTQDDDESTPGFGLIVGLSAALGAALIATSRKIE